MSHLRNTLSILLRRNRENKKENEKQEWKVTSGQRSSGHKSSHLLLILFLVSSSASIDLLVIDFWGILVSFSESKYQRFNDLFSVLHSSPSSTSLIRFATPDWLLDHFVITNTAYFLHQRKGSYLSAHHLKWLVLLTFFSVLVVWSFFSPYSSPSLWSCNHVPSSALVLLMSCILFDP